MRFVDLLDLCRSSHAIFDTISDAISRTKRSLPYPRLWQVSYAKSHQNRMKNRTCKRAFTRHPSPIIEALRDAVFTPRQTRERLGPGHISRRLSGSLRRRDRHFTLKQDSETQLLTSSVCKRFPEFARLLIAHINLLSRWHSFI